MGSRRDATTMEHVHECDRYHGGDIGSTAQVHIGNRGTIPPQNVSEYKHQAKNIASALAVCKKENEKK